LNTGGLTMARDTNTAASAANMLTPGFNLRLFQSFLQNISDDGVFYLEATMAVTYIGQFNLRRRLLGVNLGRVLLAAQTHQFQSEDVTITYTSSDGSSLTTVQVATNEETKATAAALAQENSWMLSILVAISVLLVGALVAVAVLGSLLRRSCLKANVQGARKSLSTSKHVTVEGHLSPRSPVHLNGGCAIGGWASPKAVAMPSLI
jgi:hypothetical protein